MRGYTGFGVVFGLSLEEEGKDLVIFGSNDSSFKTNEVDLKGPIIGLHYKVNAYSYFTNFGFLVGE